MKILQYIIGAILVLSSTVVLANNTYSNGKRQHFKLVIKTNISNPQYKLHYEGNSLDAQCREHSPFPGKFIIRCRFRLPNEDELTGFVNFSSKVSKVSLWVLDPMWVRMGAPEFPLAINKYYVGKTKKRVWTKASGDHVMVKKAVVKIDSV